MVDDTILQDLIFYFLTADNRTYIYVISIDMYSSAAINSSFHLSVSELNLNLYTHQIPLCQVSLSRAK